ncbi:MAG: hypothetical protein RL308_1093 [Bacteroidota bacterium]|jgi:RHS repeat-associated protein
MTTLGTAYRYDQLQLLKSMTAFEYSGSTQTTNDWFSSTSTQDYFNSYTYDKNGNIATLQRNGVSTTNLNMDNFGYILTTVAGQPSNRLGHVTDGVSSSNYTDDIDNQTSGNYSYDKLGQLTADVQEGISSMEWRFGDKKLKKITKSTDVITFLYNPLGQRVLKTVTPASGTATNTYYVYDANGQVMATYNITLSTGQNSATLDEQHIYGASRLGMKKPNILLYDNAPISYAPSEITQNTLGETYYEISNYLGNVNAVITDRKTYTTGGTSSFLAVVVSTADYYPFGMEMPGRSTNSGTYKFGYNGMEMDNEVSGNGNSYTTEFRQYDPRLGRWKSLDPLMAQFPWMSPYVAFDNNPIYYTDPYGLESKGTGNPAVFDKGGTSECDDGKAIPSDHEWKNKEVYNEDTNIIKALKRLGVGGYDEVRFNEGNSYILKVTGYVCLSSKNYKKDRFYDENTFETSYKCNLNNDQATAVPPDNNIFKEKITNTFVIRDKYVYHKQKIERTTHYFDIETGGYLNTQMSVTTIEQKQYFDRNNSDQNHKALNHKKFYSKVSTTYKPTKVIDVRLTKEMIALVDRVMWANISTGFAINMSDKYDQFKNDGYEWTRNSEGGEGVFEFPLWQKSTIK